MTRVLPPLVRISPDFPLPIHVQVKEQLKMLIATGNLLPGDMLPPLVNWQSSCS